MRKFSNRYKIVAFDMDGTLIPKTTSMLYFADLLGAREAVDELEDDFHKGLIDSTIFMNRISTIMPGLSLNFIKDNIHKMPVIDGIEDTIKRLKENDIITAIITTSAKPYADAFKEKYGFDYAYGTEFEIDGNGMLGRGLKVCSSEDKVKHVNALASQYGVAMEKVAAVGDSISDLPLFNHVGLSIALNYQECMLGKAKVYMRVANISEILSSILIPGID